MNNRHEQTSPEIKHNSHEPIKDRKMGRKAIRNWAIAAGVMVTLGVGGVLTFNALNNNSSPANSSSQHENQNSSEKPARKSVAELTEDYKFHLPSKQGIINKFEIPSDLSDQEIAETTVSRLNSWMAYGENSDFDKIANRLGDDENEEHLTGLITGTTKDASEAIKEALFWSDASTYNPGWTDKIAKQYQEINTNTLTLYAKTIKDEEPYQRTLKVMDTAKGEDTRVYGLFSGREVTFSVLEKTNADKNSSKEKGATQDDIVERRGTARLIFIEDNGTIKFSSISIDWK